MDGNGDEGSIQDPTFTLNIDLTDKNVSQHMAPGSLGLTFFSQAFDAARRSWHLKVDIEKATNEISLWLVERGETCDESQPLQVLQRSLPIKFNS